MIHVCYGLYDKTGHYSKFTGTSILSMFENTKEKVTVHIFHDDTLTDANRQRFQAVAEKYNQIIKFYNFDKICPEKIEYLREKLSNIFESRFSVGTLYRLMIDRNFFGDDVSKIIYLDSDTVVNLDIAELWNYNLENYALAAVPENWATHSHMSIKDKILVTSGKVRFQNYLCAGILIFNLDKFDSDFFYNSVQWLSNNPKCKYFDQDILNNFFAGNYCKLPPKFNSFVEIEKRLSEGTILEKIYHYAGSIALGFNMEDPYDKLFFSYFIKTAWFDLDFIGNAYKIMQKIFTECQSFTIDFSKMISGKERAFFVSQKNAIALKEAFNIDDAEEVIVLDSKQSLENLIDSLKKFRGKKFFFIMANYQAIKEILIYEGFLEYEDFINAKLFLSDINGFPVPNYQLLKYL